MANRITERIKSIGYGLLQCSSVAEAEKFLQKKNLRCVETTKTEKTYIDPGVRIVLKPDIFVFSALNKITLPSYGEDAQGENIRLLKILNDHKGD